MIRIVTLFFILLLSRYQLFSQTNGLSLVAHLDQKHGTGSGVSYNGIWGYTAPDGREYAILGTYTGTAIIDITDSASEVAFITGPSSLWREMRTYKNYAYVVTEAGGGVQIIDLAQLPATATLVQSFNYISGGKNILRSHSLEIFDSVLYLNGCAGWSPGGAVFFSLTNPTAPQFLGEYAGRYLHDSYVRNDTLYGAAINSGGGIDIVNIANKATPSLIARITYTGSGTHNTWTTTDGKYVISTDEIGSTAKNLKFWNLQTLPTPPSSPSATYTFSPSDIVHNVTVRGKYAYVAWYTAGTIVVDISDPLNPQTAGWYDSYPGASGSYDGVWSIYPYFPSGKIISGDMQTGLYVTEFNGLQPRIPVQNISPAENSILPLSTPITFQWTRTANNSNDPHYYQLHIFGYKVDTTFRTNDTTITPAITSLLYEAKPYRWHIISCDDFNTTIEPDTFLFYYGSVSTVGSLSGITFLDSNGNGSKEVGERFLSQRKIKLSGLQTDSVLTDVDGAYSFNNLSPGNYSVQIENQSGWYQTLPSSPNGYSRDVVAGGDITGINFGVTRFASVRGMKFHDVNGNGVNNGGDETGISEWMIFLSGEINDTQTTDVNGFYSFENLPVGAYVLREENRVGWTHTFPPSGLHSFTLLSGDSATGKNFGNYKFASITGTKFHDRDGDGEKDGNEEGLANWKIFLSGARVDSTVTGNDGNYSFQNLPAGNYFLQERTQSGWVQTFPPFTQYSYTLISGDSLTEQNFGNFRLGKISGKKFHDANANGLFDNGEAGLSNWKIKLFGVGYETTATNVNGEFSFSSVLAGTYTLSEIQKSGWEQTFPPTNSYTVSMVSGTDTSSLLFGNYQRSSISGTVFEDNNGNGVKEGSDAGLQNWTVYLFSPDTSTVVDSLLTGEEGYTFFGLTPGTYFLRAEQNNGWVQTSATTNEFEISSGSFISAANVGFFEYGTITGKTFNDLDSNGMQDEGEAVISDWKIYLQKDATILDSMLTNAEGEYRFENVLGGTHTIFEETRANWIQTVPQDAGVHAVQMTSGANVTEKNFGNHYISPSSDLVKYHTFANFDSVTLKPKKLKAVKIAGDSLRRMPMPNTGNARETTYARMFPPKGKGTMILGNDTTFKKAPWGWIALDKGSGFAKFFKSADISPSHPFDSIRADGKRTKVFSGVLKSPEPKKYRNHLARSLALLRLNIWASDNGVTPKDTFALGDLTLRESGNRYNGKTIRELASLSDTLLTFWNRTAVLQLNINYDSLDTTLSRINRAFEGALDTVSVSPLRLKGVRALKDISPRFLYAEPNGKHRSFEQTAARFSNEPNGISLSQNYPNPFNPTTAIGFSLLAVSNVTLKVFDILGKEVATLIHSRVMDEGKHEVEFDASNLPSGVYFYRLYVTQQGLLRYSETKKLLLMK